MKKAVSIRDVARLAGVSITSVSQVLNRTGKISAATIERVLAVVDETGYQPAVARRRTKPRGCLGILLPALGVWAGGQTFLGDNPYFSEVIAGIMDAAYKQGYETMLVTFDAEEELDFRLQGKKVAGFVLLGRHPSHSLASLRLLGLPTYLLDTSGPVGEGFGSVRIDDARAAELATQHLLALGHRHIALAESALHPQELQQSPDVQNQRRLGYRRALTEAGLPFRAAYVFGDRLVPAGGYRIGKLILELQAGITAVFATSDALAAGLMRAFHEAGHRVPNDFSVIGFDNLNTSAYLVPSLTTIDQDMRGKGLTVARLLIAQIEAESGLPQQVELPVRLVQRESTANAPLTSK